MDLCVTTTRWRVFQLAVAIVTFGPLRVLVPAMGYRVGGPWGSAPPDAAQKRTQVTGSIWPVLRF